MRRILLTIALSAAMTVGCGGTTKLVQKGIDHYERADYPGALDEFDGAGASEKNLNQKMLARYLVYRGLTEYHLKNRDGALADLTRGKEVYSRGPANWLPKGIVAEMEGALTDLTAIPTPPPSSAPPAAPPTETAVAPPAPTGEALTPAKSAAPAKTAAPVKTATAAPPPAKTGSPPTKTVSSSQSTSPK